MEKAVTQITREMLEKAGYCWCGSSLCGICDRRVTTVEGSWDLIPVDSKLVPGDVSLSVRVDGSFSLIPTARSGTHNTSTYDVYLRPRPLAEIPPQPRRSRVGPLAALFGVALLLGRRGPR